MNSYQARQFIKRGLQRVAPEAAGAWQSRRQRRHLRWFEQKMGLPEVTRSYIEQHGLCVLSGPFTGMKHVPQAAGSALMPKLVGSYETEIQEVIERITAADYERIVDIGCAEGYYAVGLARRLPNALVFAFDIDPEARRLCECLAKLNGVEARVTVTGRCDRAGLNALLNRRSLIICDCEGFEADLLQPGLIPALVQADILVELHEHLKPGITTLILDRFQGTHQAALFTAAERDPQCYPQLRFLDDRSRRLALSEFRVPGQQWAFLQSKSPETAA